MKFKKLIIENYKSFQFETEILFPESSNGKNIFLIGGMNGAGKTSILEAVNQCLYGAKADLIYRYVNRNEFSRGNFFVRFELLIDDDDGSALVIKRSWNTGSVKNPKAKDFEENLVIVRDNKRIAQNKEVCQTFIREKIPPGITQFFFFDGEKIQEIADDNYSDVKLKNSLEHALGLQYVKNLCEKIKNLRVQEVKGFIEISKEDLVFKQSELEREKSNLKRKQQERDSEKHELNELKSRQKESKKRFESTFNTAPESREIVRENEKRRIQAENRIDQLENEIKVLFDKAFPFILAGKLFDGIRSQIEAERDSDHESAIKHNSADLSKNIAQLVHEPVPLYPQKLSIEQMEELQRRIFEFLNKTASSSTPKILCLSEREASRLLYKMEMLENSGIFQMDSLLEEQQTLKARVRDYEASAQAGVVTETDRELFHELQNEIEGYANQIGRKTEHLNALDEETLTLEKRVRDIEINISKLLEKYSVSNEKSDMLKECERIVTLLNEFITRLRKNKVLIFQEKTFFMYKQLSSKSGLIKDLVIDDSSYEIRICDCNGHEIKKSGLSAGEKEVLALSLLWGLSQTTCIRLPIIIDTPLSRLDSTHRENIVKHYFPNAGDQVIILSTNTEIDKSYYCDLKPHLGKAIRLQFDQQKQQSFVKDGYFWEE